VAALPVPDVRPAVCVARQPILDVRQRVFGYELLSRASLTDTSWRGSIEHASAQVLDDGLLAIGLETLTAGRPAFLNLSRAVLLSDLATVLPPRAVVPELLEILEPDEEALDACRSLQLRGYALALDDFEPGSPAEAFLPFATYVKVDVLAVSTEALGPLTARLRARGLRVLAEKVETLDVFKAAQAAGCSLFQGYFFCRPQSFAANSVSLGQLTQVRLIAALHEPNASAATIEEIVKRDPHLTFRVLRCVNSAAFGLCRRIHSIREALLFLGLDRLRKWATIWSLASMNGGSPELINMAILRARCCELLGTGIGDSDQGAEYFLLGLCSLMDAILQRPMDTLVQQLPLSSEASDALLGRDNQARRVLDTVIAYERGAWELAADRAAAESINPADLQTAFHSALKWAREASPDTT
jgi:c-di-GMP phosphodiesterase